MKNKAVQKYLKGDGVERTRSHPDLSESRSIVKIIYEANLSAGSSVI